MASVKTKIKAVVSIGLLLIAVVAAIEWRSQDPLAAKVDLILKRDMMPGKNKWKAGMDELWELGPGIIPHLAAEAGLKDSILARNYPAWFKKFPSMLQGYLPPPVNRAELRETAMHAISEFGPLAVRGAAPQVIAGLSETNDDQNNYYAVQCVRWLLPESVPAKLVFEQGLAGAHTNWPSPESFLNVPDDSVWRGIPEVVPLLTNFLGSAGHAYEGAIAIGRIGSNAAPAIPALIQTADLGAAGSLTNADGTRFYPTRVFSNPLGWHVASVQQDEKGMNHNRAMAAMALGRIGVTTPEVQAALVRAWNAPDPWVRHNAALAVAHIGAPMTNNLQGLLAGLRDQDNSALDSKLKAIGKLGPAARDALETLRELSQTNRLLTLVTNPTAQIVGWSLEDLSVSAKRAICQIDPGEGRPFLPEIASQIGRSWDSVEFMIQPGALSNDVARAVEPLLESPEALRQSIAAYVILCHQTNHAKALAVLRRNETEGTLNDRLLAGRLLFVSLGETNGLCSLIAEAFRSETSIGQAAGQLAEKMGDAALPALPAFKAALWHKDVFVRQRAGILVIKLAPGEIPIAGGK